MVSATNKSGGVQKVHDRISKQFEGDDKMSADDASIDKLSRQICKMPGRTERDTVQSTIDLLFEIAGDKLSSDGDKEVLANLRKHVA